MSNSLYKQNIIDHYKNPKNFGELESCDFHSEVKNSSCGDEIELYLVMDGDVVEEIKFTGRGCAISIATMSMMSEIVKGKSISELKEMEKGDILDLVGMNESSGRVKCALIGYEALNKALA
jgi:nitrogen fixation NifU-like protein